MREIKFRGNRKNGTEWIFGDLNHINGSVFIFDRSPEAPLNSPDWFEVIPESVGQFTGLKDGDIDVYEGDIVQNGSEYLVICFENGVFGAKSKDGGIIYRNSWNVCGNIIDNSILVYGQIN